MDYHCEIITVTCSSFKEVIETWKKTKKRYSDMKFIGIISKKFLDEENLEVRFNFRKKRLDK